MYYHASPVAGIKVLEPKVSNHGIPLIYFSKKRENVLVYLSNAIEKFCRDTGYAHTGKWTKWASYGFRDGIQLLEEYYPNALAETYQGVSGYIYRAASIRETRQEIHIPDAAVSSLPVPVDGVEFIPDAYEAILEAERRGEIFIIRYEAMTESGRDWVRKTVQEEYDSAGEQPEYQYFLKNKFDFLFGEHNVEPKKLQTGL